MDQNKFKIDSKIIQNKFYSSHKKWKFRNCKNNFSAIKNDSLVLKHERTGSIQCLKWFYRDFFSSSSALKHENTGSVKSA